MLTFKIKKNAAVNLTIKKIVFFSNCMLKNGKKILFLIIKSCVTV
jgi:hypothetical protein